MMYLITLEEYEQIKQYRELGLSITKIAKLMNWSSQRVGYWLNKPYDYIENNLLMSKHGYPDCRQFLIDAIRLCPEISTANLMLKFNEAYPEIPLVRNSFYAYVRNVRDEIGIQKPGKRKTSLKAESEPGYEAQVDFGQYRMKDMYGLNVKVYFMAVELSYSRMRFYYFSTVPFNTALAIEAHNYAFLYFGGRPQTVMYDQDRVFVVSENYGDIVLVKEFEEFVNSVGYSIYLCRARDPQTKGKIESSVNYIKRSFLDGRIFYGIDRLNSECLHWMDSVCNLKLNATTRQRPRDMFIEEQKQLVPYRPIKPDVMLRKVGNCHISFKNNSYEIPKQYAYDDLIVRVEQRDNKLYLFDSETEELIYIHKVPSKKGNVVSVVERMQKISASEATFNINFKDNFYAGYFRDRVKERIPRYAYTQFMKLNSLLKSFSEEEITEAFKYCISSNSYNIGTILGYLIATHPEIDIGSIVPKGTKSYYTEIANEIGEKLDG